MGGTIDLNLLSVFVAVARAQGVSAAARLRGVPKSTVSRSIASLEALVHERLFHRTTRHFSLTSAGKSLLERARPLVDGLEALGASAAQGEAEPSGRLRVTAPIDFGVTVLPTVLAQFLDRFPKIDVSLELADRVTNLEAEGVDVALRAALRLKDSSLHARKLSPLEFQLFASPTYLARAGEPTSLDEVGAHRCVTLRAMKSLWPVKKLSAPRLETDDLLFLREALSAGAGLGLLPTYLAQAAVVEGRLRRVLPKYSVREGHLFFVHPAGHLPLKAAVFRDFLVEFLLTRPLTSR